MKPAYVRSVFSQNNVVNVLGVGIHPVSLEAAVGRVIGWAMESNSRARSVCVSGVHGVIEAQDNTDFCQILNTADLNVPDGMPMVWIGRLAGFRMMGRVFGPDLMLEVCKESSRRGMSHFFYGGNEGVAEELAMKMTNAFPGLKVSGTFCPPFRPLRDEERREIITTINKSQTDFLWVGLSTPKQERWMHEMLPHLSVKVAFAVGAAFDYNTGRLRRAPVWMQQTGLEWLFRLMQEPRRLFKRYLVNNPRFAALLTMQLLRMKSYSLQHNG